MHLGTSVQIFSTKVYCTSIISHIGLLFPSHSIKHHQLHFKSNICVKHSTCFYLAVNGSFPNCTLDHRTNHLGDFSGLHFLCQDSQCFENFSRIQGSSKTPAQYCLNKWIKPLQPLIECKLCSRHEEMLYLVLLNPHNKRHCFPGIISIL